MAHPLCIRTTSKPSPDKDRTRDVRRLSACPLGLSKYSKAAKNCLDNKLIDVPYSASNPVPVGIMVCAHEDA